MDVLSQAAYLLRIKLLVRLICISPRLVATRLVR